MPRNATGAYVLPSGNPVVTGTLIKSDAWANPTLADLAAEMTNSLDRNGRGGMLAPFKVADGIVTAPGVAFVAESSTGMWRPGASALSFSVSGIEALRATDTAITLMRDVTATGALNVGGALTLTGALNVTGSMNLSGNLGVSGTLTALGTVNLGTVTANSLGVTTGATFVGGIAVQGPASFAAITTFNSNVTVNAQLAAQALVSTGTLTVSGGTSLGNATINNLGVSSSTTLAGTLQVNGNANITGTLDIGSAVNIGGVLNTHDVNVNGTLTAVGPIVANGGLTASGVPVVPGDYVPKVGSTTITGQLNINSGATFLSLGLISSAVGGPYMSFGDGTVARGFVGAGALFVGGISTDFGIRTEGVLKFGTAGGSVRMTIDAPGNVGIGIAPSGAKFHVDSGAIGTIAAFASSAGGGGAIRFDQAGTAYADIGSGSNVSTGALTDFAIGTRVGNLLFSTASGFERMRIDTSGNVGIGGTPSGRLDVREGYIICRSAGQHTGYFGPGSLATGMPVTDLGIRSDNGGISFAYLGANFGMRLDQAGNFGVGINPAAWSSAHRAVQVVTTSIMADKTGTNGWLLSNLYFDGSVFRRNVAGFGSALGLSGGGFNLYSSATGAADSIVTLGTPAISVDSVGTVLYGGLEVGYRDAPPTAPIAGARTISAGDRGKALYLSAGAAITINTGMPAGSIVILANKSGGPVAIGVGAAMNLVWSGPGTIGARTLLTSSMATIFWSDPDVAFISGGLS